MSFDGSMTVQEFVQSLNKSIGVRDMGQSGFALFADHPASEELEHCLEPQLKVSISTFYVCQIGEIFSSSFHSVEVTAM